LFFQYCFSYSGLLIILYEIEYQPFHFYKNDDWNFDRDCIKHVDFFGKYAQNYVSYLWTLMSLIYLSLLWSLSVMLCSFQCTRL
jgi:hypothetical protein